jgi:hypothetical protein
MKNTSHDKPRSGLFKGSNSQQKSADAKIPAGGLLMSMERMLQQQDARDSRDSGRSGRRK